MNKATKRSMYNLLEVFESIARTYKAGKLVIKTRREKIRVAHPTLGQDWHTEKAKEVKCGIILRRERTWLVDEEETG